MLQRHLPVAVLALLALIACSTAHGGKAMPRPSPLSSPAPAPSPALLSPSPAAASPPTPTPESMCPNSTSTPGVTVLVEPPGSGAFTYTARATVPDLYLYCQVGDGFHCKTGGMIFRVTVKAALDGYVPMNTTVMWGFGNFLQLDLTDGDMIKFGWVGFHGIAQFVPPPAA